MRVGRKQAHVVCVCGSVSVTKTIIHVWEAWGVITDVTPTLDASGVTGRKPLHVCSAWASHAIHASSFLASITGRQMLFKK